jgi:hypothetical protein
VKIVADLFINHPLVPKLQLGNEGDEGEIFTTV